MNFGRDRRPGLDKPASSSGRGDVDQDGDTDIIAFDNDTFPGVYTNDGKGSSREGGGHPEPASGNAIYGNIGPATVTDIDNDGVADILAEGLQFFQVLRAPEAVRSSTPTRCGGHRRHRQPARQRVCVR